MATCLKRCLDRNNLGKWAEQVNPLGFDFDATVAFPDFFLFLEHPAILEGEDGIRRKRLDRVRIAVFRIILAQRTEQMPIRAARGCRIFHMLDQRNFDVIGEYAGFKERFHQPLEIGFPFLAVGLRPVLVGIPCCEVRKLVHGRYQERVGVEVVVYGDTVPLSVVRGTVVAEFRCTALADAEKAPAVVDPTGDNPGRWFRHIFAQLGAVVVHSCKLKAKARGFIILLY